MRCVLKDQLLDFCMVCNITIVVDSSRIVPRTTHDPSSSRNQKELKPIFGALVVDIALDQSHEPVGGDPLRLEVFAHIVVPHVSGVHGAIIADKGP